MSRQENTPHRQKGVHFPVPFEQAVEGLAAVPGPRATMPSLTDEQRGLLLYLGSDADDPQQVRHETLGELVALGLLTVKGENHVAFTPTGDALYERLLAEATEKKPRRKKKL